MNLRSVSQVPLDDLSVSYDLVIVASGYESRARYIAEQLQAFGTRVKDRMVLSFLEHPFACARPANDAVFENLGYRKLLCSGGSDEEVARALSSALASCTTTDQIRILVDVSSMTRVWYGSVVRTLIGLHLPAPLLVHFAYCAAAFSEPPNDYPSNRVVAPVSGFSGNELPDKPTALVVGLGYDKDRAIGLKDYLDPQLTVLLYADPADDVRYVSNVLTVNSGLIAEVGDDRVFAYPLTDCAATFHLIESVCKGVSLDWRVVLCSLGSKLFGLCCFLVASVLRDISIWRVSADSHETPADHRASGRPIILSTVWTCAGTGAH